MESSCVISDGVDLKFRHPRIWSNKELLKFSSMFSGRVLNVSAGKDIDKEGSTYRKYFTNASEYWMSQYNQKDHWIEKEFYLDLEKELEESRKRYFDLVFNHTTLEHVYNVKNAFHVLTELTRDVLIVVVPFLQQLHYDDNYRDYWRFTPFTMKRLYEEEGLTLRYCSANGQDKTSIYLFCVGYRSEKWSEMISEKFDITLDPSREKNNYSNVIGANVIV